MEREQSEMDLSSIANAISIFIDKALSEEGQKKSLDKITHYLDVANQLIDNFDPDLTRSSDKPKKPESHVFQGKSIFETLKIIIYTALNNPDSLAKHYGQFASTILQILGQQSDLTPEPSDKRFKNKLWQDSNFFHTLLQIYLAWNQNLQAWLEDQNFSYADKQRVQFILNQFISAFSPSNLPINPSALKRAENTEGQSAVKGILNCIKDVTINHSMPRQINPDAYSLGINLAITPGKVIFRNEQLELIQYQALTSKVHRRPTLLIPPQINKYYLFDLKPRNSILGYLQSQEIQMFTVSWKNPDKEKSHWGLDVYISALLEAIEAIRDITKSRSVNLISACAGCYTATALLGYLAESQNPVIHSHTIMVTALTPNNDSILELFATRNTIKLAKAHSKIEGIMDGKSLAKVFAWLRPNDLVWNYWVNNYLMGRDPPPLDVLYWDNDSTHLPAALHRDFIEIYENEVFVNPGRHQVLGKKINYKKVKVDSYVIAGEDDYLMPWKGVYLTTKLFRGKHRFVLSTSGHVQSILRPPSLACTEYFTNDVLPHTADNWLSSATIQKGSWWDDWIPWLQKHSGAQKKAPQNMGSKNFPAIADAPGDYIHEKI